MIKFHSIDLNDVALYCAEAPGPGPALVLLHGLSGSHAEFLHLLPELAKHAYVYALDLRGHGLSGRTAGAYQVADYGRDVAAFLHKVVGKPAVVAGHSLGGLIAVWLAGHVPQSLRGIFLADPGLYIMQMPRFRETGFYPYFATLRKYLRQYHAAGASLEDMIAYVGQSPVDGECTMLDVVGPGAVRERAVQLHQMDPAVLDPALEGILFGDDEPDDLLAQIRCPVHLLAAQFAMGGAMDARDVQRAVSKMPHCTYTVLERTGHDIHLERPWDYVNELKQFLSFRRQQSMAAVGLEYHSGY